MAAVRMGKIRRLMSGETRHSREGETPGEERQLKLDEELSSADPDRCEAIANSTGERCRQPAMGPFPYCGDHKHLLDDVDLERMGLK